MLLERRSLKNIRTRLRYDFKSTFINSAFDHFEARFAIEIDLRQKRHLFKFKETIESSLTKTDSYDKVIPKYIFSDRDKNTYTHTQIAERVIEMIRNNYDEYESSGATVREVIDYMVNYICANYELSFPSREYDSYSSH